MVSTISLQSRQIKETVSKWESSKESFRMQSESDCVWPLDIWSQDHTRARADDQIREISTGASRKETIGDGGNCRVRMSKGDSKRQLTRASTWMDLRGVTSGIGAGLLGAARAARSFAAAIVRLWV